MGNESSFLKENKNNEMINLSFSKLFSEEIESNYEGIKTSKNSENSNEEKTLNDIEHSTESSTSTEEVNKSVTFEWKEKGSKMVFLTGSFCNWKQDFLMINKENEFTLTLVFSYLIN